MTELTVHDAAEKLYGINQKVSERFVEVCGQLDQLPRADLVQFAEDCLAVADSGWRSFEPLNTLLNMAEDLQASNRLMVTSGYCRELSGYSYEPVQAYLELVSHSIESGGSLQALEETGLSLHGQYQHASSLVAGYFRSAICLVDANDRDDWIALVKGIAEVGRDQLQDLLKLTPDCHRWQTALVLLESPDNCLTWVRRVSALEVVYGARLHEVEKLLVKCADMPQMDELLSILSGLVGVPHDERNLLLELAFELPNSDAVLAFLGHAGELPLRRPDVVREWLRSGVSDTAENEAALVAFLSQESMRSQEALKYFRGQVSLADHQRTFDLLVEALSARQLMIEAVEEAQETQQFRQDRFVSIGSDARTIYLPEIVNLFDTQDDNFSFYKVSIFHQVGLVEFGCFRAIEKVEGELARFEDERLGRALFQILEDARIDWQLAFRYPGLVPQLRRLKQLALDARNDPVTPRVRLMEELVRTGLDSKNAMNVYEGEEALHNDLRALVLTLSRSGASIADALSVTSSCYDLIVNAFASNPNSYRMSEEAKAATMQEFPEPVTFRGEIEVSEVARSLRIEALVEALEEEGEVLPDGPEVQMPGSADEQFEIGDLEAGEVSEGVSMILSELERELEAALDTPESGDGKGVMELLGGLSSHKSEPSRHKYDEWDHVIADYRAGWCTLYEHRHVDEDELYFRKVLFDNQDLSTRIRHQLNKVKPEMLRKVKGVIEGEELDLERSIAYVVDRKVGLTPDETIYVQRQRKERDVSTLFLLDMSASTDDIVHDASRLPPPAPDMDDDDEFLMRYFEQHRAYEADARRIIDLEKESVILMADALESLGDAYSVCGFSGYGRDQVDYFLCKDFDEPFNARVKGKIGGIKPCRSTRMGAPIRHATRRLIETGSRIKALIIISDGYPQDHDYGTDRNSREYGLNDTMKALSEAKQQGVLSYCLTVDPSGHDYLRAMCPDSQYMVIQDISQLPEELSRVYRSLTG
ncbi:MAG: hypothetical protein JJ957_07265 [Pseudomonadales bacterium]|nr:hypothetical protein [Pseudomonadales bacterium]MBO6595626.1 hypothetical protein [Pseudomonadales bacterium]MBO6820816.1 hypothetical protein [Pseudomonadales bacterium]